MSILGIWDETAPLEKVILGTCQSMGPIPPPEEVLDPKSREHVRAGTYPVEEQLRSEEQEFLDVLHKYAVEVYQPGVIPDYNQIFARDIGFVIGDRWVLPVIAEKRRREQSGINHIVAQCDQAHIRKPSPEERMEGGDIIVWRGHLFVGYSGKRDFDTYITARTNEAGVEYLMSEFQDWKVHAFELKKSDEDPRQNVLHLDCCFQPIGEGQAIYYPGGFKNQEDVDFLKDFFGESNMIEVSQQEMYDMNTNVFSISPKVVVSEASFIRLNTELRRRGFTVEEVKYSETAKMEGLLRCSTLPLKRRYG